MRKVFRDSSLEEISERIDYGLTESASAKPLGPKFLRITDIQKDGVSWNTVPYCACSESDQEKYALRTGDIVFARTGATTGKSFLITDCPESTVFASYLIRVRPKPSVDPRYLQHFFRTPDYWRQVNVHSAGSTQPGVNATKLKSLTVPLPPREEQERIAAILNKADAIRRKRQQALQLADEFLRSVFLDMFGDPAANPKHWPLKQLVEVSSKFSDGPFGSNLKTSHYDCAGIRVVRLQNIGAGTFLDDNKAFISREHYESLPQHHCRPGDVLIGTLGEPNLRACILPDHIQEALNKADCVQLRPDTQKAEAEYLCSLLNCRSTLSMASSLILGQTRLRISMGRLRGLMVPVPPLAIQQRFSHLVRRLRNLRSCQESSDVQQKVLFGSLVQRGFRGEL